MQKQILKMAAGIVCAVVLITTVPFGMNQVQAAEPEKVFQVRTKGLDKTSVVDYNDAYFYLEKWETQTEPLPQATKYNITALRKYNRNLKDTMLMLGTDQASKEISTKSIAFVSAAVNGKVSDFNQGEELTPITTAPVSEWKLTIKNPYDEKTNPEGLREPDIDNVQMNNHLLSFDYENLYSTGNCYLSAVILNKGESEVIAYDRLVSAAERGNGTVVIHWPTEYDYNGYTVKVFAEQYNGDGNTDYISKMQYVYMGRAFDEKIEDWPTF